MPQDTRPFGNRARVQRALQAYRGQFAIQEVSSESYPFDGAGVSFLSGGTNALIPDVPYTATTQTLIPGDPYSVPANRRLHCSNLYVNVHGGTAWTTGDYVAFKSTGESLLAYIPLAALIADAAYIFPVAGEHYWSKRATVTAYNSTTGAMTFAASTWLGSDVLAKLPFFVVAGTGIGQGGVVLTSTTTVLTPNAVLPVALSTDSVVKLPYYVATAGGNTSITASNGGFSASQFKDNIYYVYIISGTGAGQYRLITDNSTTALTVATWTTNPDTTSVFIITRMPWLNGVVSSPIQQQFTAPFGLGEGLRAVVAGTMGAGSSLRVGFDGNLVQ